MVAATQVAQQQGRAGDLRAVEHDDADGEDDLEGDQLRGDAAALPRKMPAGSRPERRSASRPPSADSMAKARWMASRAQNSTATQNRPELARSRIPRSGSRATPNRTSTRRANGRHLVGGDPRAQLDAQVLAGDQRGVTEQGRAPACGARRRGGDVGGAAGQVDDPVGEGLGPVERRGRRRRTVAPAATASRDEAVEEVAARPRRGRRGARRAATARGGGRPGRRARCAGAGRRRAGRRRRRPGGRSSPQRARAASMSAAAAPAARPQKRTLSATVRSS